MKKNLISPVSLCCVTILMFSACSKDDPAPAAATLVKEWNLALSTKNENPAPPGRTETGTVAIQLMSDNSINYTINVSNLAATDALSAAHIHVGDPITNGGVILNFAPVFSGSSATGTIPNVRSSFVDSLKNDVNELYFNVHSTQVPGGLVRAQLNTTVDMAADVVLSGANEVGPVTTTAVGLALLRLTTDKKLYYKVAVTNLEAGDALQLSHIHKAAAGVNGPVIVDLYANAAEFGVGKMTLLTDALFASVKADPTYVNVHSANHPGGVVRGQIR
jgi:hypothetical protein